MFLLTALVYIASIVTIWIGADLIVNAIDKVSRNLRLSTFSVSFFVLGLLTSIPEIAVGVNSLNEGKTDIFVGNLIGGVAVLFLFAIPLIAVAGKGIKITRQLNDRTFIFSIVVMLAPAILILDKKITNLEGVLLIVMYLVLFYLVEKNHGVFDRGELKALEAKNFSLLDVFKILLGVILVFIASENLVNKSLDIARILEIPAFYVSLIILSIGTNVPEISLGISSVINKKKDVAFGDYIGSACANTLIFGVLSIVNDGEVLAVKSFWLTFTILFLGLAVFFGFTRSKEDISRREGYALMVIYFLFAITELLSS